MVGKIICRIMYRVTEIIGLKGDITRLDVDAIVNPANSLMVMGGGVAGAIKRRGGKIIEEEAKRHAPVPVGRAVVTSAGRLPARYVIHVPTMERPAMVIPVENAYKATRAALIKALDLSLESIALPGMGTGVGGLSPREAGEAMARAIKEILDLGTKLKKIYVVDLNEEIPLEVCRNIEAGP